MENYEFDDVLTASTVVCAYPQISAAARPLDHELAPAKSVFFPGCSFINYGLPLVKAVYDLLRGADAVQGISLLCCGKILEYEPDGAAVRAAFEADMCEHVLRAGVERIVAACPNCVLALRGLLAADPRTEHVEVVALPVVLADLGYRVDPEIAAKLVAAETSGGGAHPVTFAVHDSCPDRASGEFAQGLRDVVGASLISEQEHNRSRSLCCGSLARAAGKYEQADKIAKLNGKEAVDAGADAIVVPCVSCAFQLSVAQEDLPVYHYLELLYDWRIDWRHADQWMKLRFLFDAEEDAGEGGRSFVGIDASKEN